MSPVIRKGTWQDRSCESGSSHTCLMHRFHALGTNWAQLGDGCAETDTHGSCARVFDHKGWWGISSDTRFTTRDYD